MFGKKLEIISRRLKNLQKTERFSSYIRKKVFSKSGELVGKVKDITTKKDNMIGLIVNGNKKVFIGKEFFDFDSKDVIMLSINPVTSLIGKHVFDAEGRRLGYVKGLERKNNANDFESLVVKKAFYLRALKIPKEDVVVSKKNIILKKAYR